MLSYHPSNQSSVPAKYTGSLSTSSNQHSSQVGVGDMYLGLGGTKSVSCRSDYRQGTGRHTECLTSPALSLTASVAAEARVPADASESFATSVILDQQVCTR